MRCCSLLGAVFIFRLIRVCKLHYSTVPGIHGSKQDEDKVYLLTVINPWLPVVLNIPPDCYYCKHICTCASVYSDVARLLQSAVAKAHLFTFTAYNIQC